MPALVIRGAREHNLKNIDVEFPRNKLTVVSGLSGSGKSSLAFDTVYAEGRRRYVESLSAYARQFLGRMQKPAVDYIEGLSPAIAIEQSSPNRNPRSTVGTVTEIHDYLRLLYARVGVPHDPTTGHRLEKQTVDQMVDAIMGYPEGSRVALLAPVVREHEGGHREVFRNARRGGFSRIRVDGEMLAVDEAPELADDEKHSVELVVDRLKVGKASRARIADSVETALELSGGEAWVLDVDRAHDAASSIRVFSRTYRFADPEMSLPELEPRLFSFNNPYGACPACSGLGITLEFDKELVVPDSSLSFNEGGIVPYSPTSQWHRSKLESLAEHFGFDLDTPFGELPEHVRQILWYGSDEPLTVRYVNKADTGRFEYETRFPGILKELERRYTESSSPAIREWLEEFMSRRPCPTCGGTRLRPEARAVRVGGRSIVELSAMPVDVVLEYFSGLELSENERHISGEVIRELTDRLRFLRNVGLSYLTLDRAAATLSGGEAQRIRLATQIGSSLVGVLYVLDEPTIGLHQRDTERLLSTLHTLRDLGNTLVVVEHDEQTLRSADHIVDLGPGAGVQGGYVVAAGTPDAITAVPESKTGAYLAGKQQLPLRAERRPGNGAWITLRGCRKHNLCDIDVGLPLGTMCGITGVSGSGKSTLVETALYPALKAAVGHGRAPGADVFDSAEGFEQVDKVIKIDQTPIGRTPRSNPATYVGLYTAIREVFAKLPESRARGYKPGRFSFNVKGGRCENCGGAGTIRIEMHFLSDVYVPCDVCGGKRFNRETLEVHYKGKSISEVLDLTVDEARDFFSAVPAARRKIETLAAVGLGYVTLGQNALTLSGGEAQRVKLANELSKRATGGTVYLLDEPTTGLHFEDVRTLLNVLDMLVDDGNTVVLIEHNMDVIAHCDYIVDLGPEGGGSGGRVVATGRPEEVAEVSESHTGRFLKETLSRKREKSWNGVAS